MDGFSGAPIIGFHKTEEGVSYLLVAIQSGWHSGLRVIAGPLLPAVGDWIDRQLEQM